LTAQVSTASTVPPADAIQPTGSPILERLHAWLLQRRTQVPNGSGIARAIDYSLKRWAALTHYVGDGRVPIDNNWIENQIRPIALGRNYARPSIMQALRPRVLSSTEGRVLCFA
jgi:hypothetical protein